MKIAILTPFINNYGGGEVFIQNLVSFCGKNDHENSITVFTADKTLVYENYVLIPEINTYKKFFKNLNEVINIVARFDPDCVVLNDIFLSQFSILFKKRFKCVLSLIHGEIDYNNINIKVLKSLVTFVRLKGIKCGSRYVLSVNKRNFELYKNNKNVIVIGNFTIPNNVEIDQKTHDYNFLYCGRLVKLKNLNGILNVYKAIIDKFEPSATLTIVGDGPLREDICRYIKQYGLEGKVRLAGQISHNMIGEYYCRADCLLLLSVTEGFPTVILEALNYGIPCVVTKVGSNDEIIKNGYNGYVCDINDDTENIAKLAMQAINLNKLDCKKSIEKYYIAEFYKRFIELIYNAIS